jgi:hypothetical protein
MNFKIIYSVLVHTHECPDIKYDLHLKDYQGRGDVVEKGFPELPLLFHVFNELLENALIYL